MDDEKLGREVIASLRHRCEEGLRGDLAGNADAPNLRKRVDGVKKEAGLYPGIQIVGTFNHVETPVDAAAEVTALPNGQPAHLGVGDDWRMGPLHATADEGQPDPKKVKVVASV